MSTRSAIVGLLILIGVVAIIVITPENYQPCPTEDSTWCVWTGGENGEGSTVINFWDNAYIVL